MFKALRNWVADILEDEPSAEIDAAAAAEQERRLDARHDFTGHDVVIRNRRVTWKINLKDVSCKGACGISEQPVAVGEIVFLELSRKRFNAAQVRWVRNSLIGLHFFKPLQPDLVEKLHAAHVARTARAAARAAKKGRGKIASGRIGARH